MKPADQDTPRSDEQSRSDDDMLDEASDQSFPASDPPAWISRRPKDTNARPPATRDGLA